MYAKNSEWLKVKEVGEREIQSGEDPSDA